jgi:hypothetical protein
VSFFLWLLVLGAMWLIYGLRNRLDSVEGELTRHQETIDELTDKLRERRTAVAPPPHVVAPAVPPEAVRPAAIEGTPTAAPPKPIVKPPPVAEPHAPVRWPKPPSPPPPPRVNRPTPSTPVPAAPRLAIDWENLVGVKLFSAVAGVALVLAAIFFLRYSIERGWLQPPVRVAIGVIVATALLVVCERKAARKYPITANALDAAAIAILFSTFFAAHALWNLIPTTATFGLLVLVTCIAVLLSIRHDSLFIAVLGLLGGFSTPALLSTGENQPVPLFTYLLLLNVGLAWVAYRKGWAVLTILTLVLTTIYQWGWVFRFLTANQLSLAMGIFLLFCVTSFVAVTFSRRGLRNTQAGSGRFIGTEEMDALIEKTGLAASAMPLVFAIYLAAVPAFGAQATLLFGFLFVIDAGLLAIAVARREELVHAIGGVATLLVLMLWLALSYATSAWVTAIGFTALFVVFYALAPIVAARAGRRFEDLGSVYTAPFLLFVFPVVARIEPAVASPFLLFGTLFVLLALLGWRALVTSRAPLYFVAAFFGVAAEASWSATHLVADRLGAALALYATFGVYYLGVPLAARRLGRPLDPPWGAGAVLMASLAILLFLASGPQAAAGLWGLAILLAILNAGLFIESAAGRLPLLSAVGGALSWVVLAVWWMNAAAVVGILPSLVTLVGLTLVMLAGHAWAHAETRRHGDASDATDTFGFHAGIRLGLVGHLFLFFVMQNPEWSNPPWPALATMAVLTLAVSAASLFVESGVLHAAGVTAAAAIVLGWAVTALGGSLAPVAIIAAEAVIAYAVGWLWLVRRKDRDAASIGAVCALFIGEFTLVAVSVVAAVPLLAALTLAHSFNLALILWLAWNRQWPVITLAAVAPAWLATMVWHERHPEPDAWRGALALAMLPYTVFVAYPFVLGRRVKDAHEPHLTAVLGSAFLLVAARNAFLQGGMSSFVGIVPVAEGIVLALLLQQLLRLQPPGSRDLGRLALVAGASLAFATVAIPLQLRQQWITIGWALEGAALAWLYTRIPHRGLLYWAFALLAAVFARLALNPEVFVYEPRGMRVFNWYLYTYLTCGVALLVSAWWLSKTADQLVPAGGPWARASALLPAGSAILLFLLLNIEIADFYATGPEITFRFGVTIAQDLTYTIGWLIFGLVLLAAGIYSHNRPGRIAAVALITITMCKAFLYDMSALGGLYRVASLVGLALSLSLVALALQKFVLQAPKESL